jgi:hypothetical protein
MERVYIVNEDGKTLPMDGVLCRDEDKELQCLIENNFDLIPGDQIDPEAPCRWMLIKREMPVPDPYTGTDRWSIDFFFVDQNATPTFVECKRFADTRSRREVVGQVLEYAANGQHYWSSDCIRMHAEASAKAKGTTVDLCFKDLQSDVADSAEDLFQQVENRLKAGELRIVFFLEQAPNELKRLVEFLNKQMNLTEVLLVEARQYSRQAIKIVAPRVFGFTEQARALKLSAGTHGTSVPVATDWQGFTANAGKKGLDEQSIGRIRELYDGCKALSAEIAWGRGTKTASFSPKWPSIHAYGAPFSVYANGNFELHVSSFGTSETATSFIKRFTELLEEAITLPLNYTDKWVSCPPAQWLPKVDLIVKAVGAAVREQQLAISATA